jgi:hypothetical protein
MPDDPADRIHLAKMPRTVFIAYAFQRAQPFASCESELVDEGMGVARPLRWSPTRV